jgi:hypothetical protein
MLGRTGDRIVRDWLKRGILVERETSVLTSAADAIAAAKLRGRDVAGAIPGKNLTPFVWWTPPARFWAFSPRIPMPKGDKRRPLPSGSDAARERYVVDGRAQPRSTGLIIAQDDEPIPRPALPRFGRAVRESGTWTRMLDPHVGIKAARGGARAQVNEDGAFCCWCGLPATLLLRRWLGSLLACF